MTDRVIFIDREDIKILGAILCFTGIANPMIGLSPSFTAAFIQLAEVYLDQVPAGIDGMKELEQGIILLKKVLEE